MQKAAEPSLKHGRQSAEIDIGCASHSFMFSECRFVQLQKFSLTKETAAVFSMHSDLPTITSKCGLVSLITGLEYEKENGMKSCS